MLTFQGSKQTFVSIQLKFFRKAFGINVLKVAVNLCCNSIKSCSTEIFQKLLLNLETAPIVCSDIFELRKEKTYSKALHVVFTFCKKIFTYSSLFIGSCQYFLTIIFISALFTKLKVQLTWDRVAFRFRNTLLKKIFYVGVLSQLRKLLLQQNDAYVYDFLLQ